MAAVLDGVPADASIRGLARMSQDLPRLLDLIQEVDAEPTVQVLAAIDDVKQALDRARSQWDEIANKDLPALNVELAKAGLPSIKP